MLVLQDALLGLNGSPDGCEHGGRRIKRCVHPSCLVKALPELADGKGKGPDAVVFNRPKLSVLAVDDPCDATEAGRQLLWRDVRASQNY